MARERVMHQAGVCWCESFAVGQCLRCAQPVCGAHSEIAVDGALLCGRCHSADEAAHQAAVADRLLQTTSDAAERARQARLARTMRVRWAGFALGSAAAIVVWVLASPSLSDALAGGFAGAIGYTLMRLGRELTAPLPSSSQFSPANIYGALLVSLVVGAPIGFLVGAGAGLLVH